MPNIGVKLHASIEVSTTTNFDSRPLVILTYYHIYLAFDDCCNFSRKKTHFRARKMNEEETWHYHHLTYTILTSPRITPPFNTIH